MKMAATKISSRSKTFSSQFQKTVTKEFTTATELFPINRHKPPTRHVITKSI